MERVTVKTDVGYRTTATTANHRWHGDMGVPAGGTDTGPNPEEMLLGALGSCIVMTLHMYANRKGWALRKVEIDLEYEKKRAGDVPEYDGDEPYVHVLKEDLRFLGDLDDKQRARLMEISQKCPVRRIITGPKVLIENEVRPDPA